MRRYETIFIIDSELSEDGRGPVFQRLEDLIQQHSGFLAMADEWGARKLAYPIEKKARGYYVRLDYCGDGSLVSEIERFFRIDDRILKFMTVVLDRDVDLDRVKEEVALAEAEAKAKAEAKTKSEDRARAEAEAKAKAEAEAKAKEGPSADDKPDQEKEPVAKNAVTASEAASPPSEAPSEPTAEQMEAPAEPAEVSAPEASGETDPEPKPEDLETSPPPDNIEEQ